MKKRTSDLVRESFYTNPPKRVENYTRLSEESWILSETVENSEYRLIRTNYYSYSSVMKIVNLEAYSLYVKERFLLLFWRWKQLDIAETFLQHIFVDFYVRRKQNENAR